MVSLRPICPLCGFARPSDEAHVCYVATKPSKTVGDRIIPFGPGEIVHHAQPEALSAGWITTFTGRRVYPLRMSQYQIDLLDIAHSLSMRCRYSGHTRRFYSVAEHSILMAQWMIDEMKIDPKKNALAQWALLHDASEAYLPDISAPIKPVLNGFKMYENLILLCVAERFGLIPYSSDNPEGPSVKAIDRRIRIDEAAATLNQAGRKPTDGFDYGEPLGVAILSLVPEIAERQFLRMAEKLGITESTVP